MTDISFSIPPKTSNDQPRGLAPAPYGEIVSAARAARAITGAIKGTEAFRARSPKTKRTPNPEVGFV